MGFVRVQITGSPIGSIFVRVQLRCSQSRKWICESTNHMQPIKEGNLWEYKSHAANHGSGCVRVQLPCSQSRRRICECTTPMQPITEADVWESNSHAVNHGSGCVRVQLAYSQSQKRMCETESTIDTQPIKVAGRKPSHHGSFYFFIAGPLVFDISVWLVNVAL
jgi:hypothetical protein